jgi:site-specific DNA-methyltransferase (adenine-specific)
LYGIAITELTALMSRRTVYCSKHANGKYSILDSSVPSEGNIIYTNKPHEFDNGKCIFCGATQTRYGRENELEQHAYQFIHTSNPDEIFNMKFDVIIGNPPYQLNVGVEKENYAVPIYQNFVEQAKKLNPRYLSMIIPARWYAGGRGLDSFREEMLNDDRVSKLVDFPNAVDCFPGVDISGGVCYFLWERDYRGECEVTTFKGSEAISKMKRPLLEKGAETFIRFNESISILHKVQGLSEKTFDSLVSPQTPFGILTSFKEYKDAEFDGSIALYSAAGRKFIDANHIKKKQTASKRLESIHFKSIWRTWKLSIFLCRQTFYRRTK